MSELGDLPLDPWMRAALLAEGLEDDPTPAARHRMASRMATATGLGLAALLPEVLANLADVASAVGGSAAAAGGAAAGGAAAATGAVVASKTVAVIVGAAIAGGAVGVTVSELRPREREVIVAPIDASIRDTAAVDAANVADAPDPVADAAVDTAVDAAVDEAVLDASTRTTVDARTRTLDAPPTAVDADVVDDAPADRTIAREEQLIDTARKALRRGDLAAANRALIEHELRYPTGALTEERLVLAIEHAVASGDRADAVRRATSFRQRYPQSLFLGRIDALTSSD